jgi:hypothetical protein
MGLPPDQENCKPIFWESSVTHGIQDAKAGAKMIYTLEESVIQRKMTA